MASPASLAYLGSARPISSIFDTGPSNGVVTTRYRFISRVSFGSSRWPHSCHCMVTTGLVEEKGIKVSSESNVRETANGSGTNSNSGTSGTSTSSSNNTGTNEGQVLLKPSPKPALMRPNAPTVMAPPQRPAKPELNREKISESLDEVLDKVEKLEMKPPIKPPTREVRNNSRPNIAPNPSNRPTTSVNPQAQNPNAFKSVWKKGEAVAPVQEKAPKEAPKIITRREISQDSSLTETPKPFIRANQPEPTMALPPKRQMSAQLQSKPSIAPPPVRKPTIPLQKPSAPVQTSEAPVRKGPILIDKFAAKKPISDPLNQEEDEEPILLPPKPKKSPQQPQQDQQNQPQQFKRGKTDQFRKKSGKRFDDEEDESSSSSGTRSRGLRRRRRFLRDSLKHQEDEEPEPIKAEIIEVGADGMPMDELASELALERMEIVRMMIMKGYPIGMMNVLDRDMVKMVCREYGVEVLDTEVRVEEMARKKEVLEEDDLESLETRPPVITIMGHVDHGKTTLLDYIRKSKVVASEAGGITQGIGAYKVLVPVSGELQPCVFLDTPGHEAFGAMRARGARVTDITIIVVAADDGVQPQTNEAIAHAKAAKVPIIIAINKIDREGANADRVMQELANFGVVCEAWGGDVPMVPISALKGENIDDLLETVMLVAEMQELKANPNRKAKGTVIEAGLDKSRGPLVTLIVQNGTLKRGDIVVCGEAFGKVRAMFDDRGSKVDKAGPSYAVQVIGFSEVPVAGDEFEVVGSLDEARSRASDNADKLRLDRITAKTGQVKASLSTLASRVLSGKTAGLDRHQLNIVLKVDVQGSIEAIRHSVQGLPQENVNIKFVLQAPGDVSTSDVDLAAAAEAVVLGFNVKVPGPVKTHAEKNNVEIRLYKVIYDMIDGLRNAMEGLLDLAEEQVPIGLAEVQAVFSRGSGKVAGCMISEGKIKKDSTVNVLRNGKKIYTGKVDSLRRVKEDVKEVGVGLECGIGVENFDEWEEGDVIEAFNLVRKQRTLEEASATVEAALVQAGFRQ
ncbi:hypothetical protein LUZ60_017382 [Juncus effusus]|nr:hypothetical protein LUZ60_017382 [Juncus effusus]